MSGWCSGKKFIVSGNVLITGKILLVSKCFGRSETPAVVADIVRMIITTSKILIEWERNVEIAK